MNSVHDILLGVPIPQTLLRGLLFVTFMLHLLFVLLMLGTAILALSYFIQAWWAGRLRELRWDKKILRMFLMHKSLAVVLGVGPLLLIQVGFSVPFFTAVALLSPFWLLIILFLILSFVSFDSLGHKIHVQRYLHLGFGIVAMITLLCVPGFFVAVLTAAENPHQWRDIVFSGFGFDWRLSLHWALRYLHVIGASLVFAPAFHYLFLARGPLADRKRALGKWMLLGLLLQFVTGVPLYWSLLIQPPKAVLAFVFIGIVLGAMLVWLVATRRRDAAGLRLASAAPLLMGLLVTMLLARQLLQDKGFSEIAPQATANARQYRARLATYEKPAAAKYQQYLALSYHNGPIIYAGAARSVTARTPRATGPTPTTWPSARRTSPPSGRSGHTSLSVLLSGVPGTAMPRFGYYDADQRTEVLDYLAKQFDIFSPPARPKRTIPDDAFVQARKHWSKTCSTCHGPDGRGTQLGAKFRPPPPDLTQYALTPERAFDVITHGYPGTQMAPFAALPEPVRWGLVEIVRGMYEPGPSEKSRPAGPSTTRQRK